MIILYISLAVINLIVFLCFGIDKFLAKNKMYRIPEKVLITLSIAGGAFGALLGMVLFNHKTSKPKFRYTIPFLCLIYAAYLLYK